MKLPRCLQLVLGCVLAFTAQAQTSTYTPSARQWWVYLTPSEGVGLYQSPDFATIKAEADAYANLAGAALVSGAQPTFIKHGHDFVEESARALELLSATFFALKHGVHGGNGQAPALDNYRAKIGALWLQVVERGPVAQWTEKTNVSSVQVGTTTQYYGWSEGDIALRSWLSGAIASYDAVRYDLNSEDARRIDEWLAALRDQMKNLGWTYGMSHNRGISRSAQVHVFSLVLQDATEVNSIYGGTRGLKQALPGYLNNAPRSSQAWNDPATTEDESLKTVAEFAPAHAGVTGFSSEHGYKTGVYGRHSTKYLLNGYAALTRAARNRVPGSTAATADWDIDTHASAAQVGQLFDTWLRYSDPADQKPQYLAYCKALEDWWTYLDSPPHPGTARSSASSLNAGWWAGFAWKDARFLTAEGWATAPGGLSESAALSALWLNRCRVITNSPILIAENFNATAVGALPAGWTATGGAGASAAVAVVDSASGERGLVFADSSTSLSANAGVSFAAQSGTVTAEWSFRQAASSRWNNFQLLSGATRAVELYTTNQLTQGGSIPYGLVYRNASGQDVALATLSTGVWYDLKVVANPATDTFKVYLNGTALAGGADLPFRNAVSTIDAWNAGTGSNSTQTSLAVDDLVISR